MNIMKANVSNVLQITWATLAAVCVSLAANPAKAADVSITDPQLAVSYTDLNLASKQGVAQLYGRIQGAAIAVCGGFDGPEMRRSPAVNACIHRAIDKAVSAVNNPKLTSQYLAVTGSVQKQQDVASLH
jgi:UrcA family protein